MKISAIGFDWYGVLAQTPGGGFSEAAADFLGVTVEGYRAAYLRHNHMVNKEKNGNGYGDAIEMWQKVLSEVSQGQRIDEFMEFVRSRPKAVVNPEMMNLVKKLRGAGWKVGMFSNNSEEGAREFRAQGYDKLFDAALFSAEVDCMKPETEAFQKLAIALQTPVTELVFIDDSESSLSTAGDAGYIPVLFRGHDILIGQLNELGVKMDQSSTA